MKTSDLTKLAVFLSVSVVCLCAHSQTFQVTTTADSGPGSLRDAMTNAIASGGGTITFSNLSGPISILSALPDISGSLTIRGNGPANTAIGGNRTNRIFNVLGGATCSISDLTLQAGIPPIYSSYPVYNGAKAIVNAGALSVSNCLIRDNGSGSSSSLLLGGGGITSVGSSLVLNSVVFSNNAAYGLSFTLSASNVMATNCLFIGNMEGDQPPVSVAGDSVFSDTTFTGNQANFGNGEGGGINAGGNLTLLNCNITNNYGDWSSGGIYFNGNNLTISNCVVNNNSSSQRYGGIYASATNILILNSTISANEAGGMHLGGNTTISGCTISSNRNGSSYFGGGVTASDTLNMTNCTISANTIAGVFCDFGNTRAVNCTIAFNAIGVDNSVYPSTFYALNTLIANNGSGSSKGFLGTLTSQGHNLIGNLNTNMTIVGSTNGNIYGVDPLLGPLQNNGGPTLTHALMKGSPAIDAGASDGAPPIDQRGVPRPYGPSVDIGAFESEYNVLRFTDISRANSTNVHVQVEGLPGSVCTFQASSNFLDWDNVFVSGSNSTGVWEFIDEDAANHPTRFYRALIEN